MQRNLLASLEAKSGGGGKGAPAAGLGRKPGLHPRGEGLKALKEMSEVKKKSKGILRGLVTEKCKRFLSCWEVLPEKKAKQTHTAKKRQRMFPPPICLLTALLSNILFLQTMDTNLNIKTDAQKNQGHDEKKNQYLHPIGSIECSQNNTSSIGNNTNDVHLQAGLLDSARLAILRGVGMRCPLPHLELLFWTTAQLERSGNHRRGWRLRERKGNRERLLSQIIISTLGK